MTIFSANGLMIAADVVGEPNGLPVVLMHGGGQTRHSWKNGAIALAAAGYYVVSLDARGHGESSWDAAGDYSIDAMVGDLKAVLGQIPPRPALVGASMGGVTALAAVGSDPALARALVLVDITPRIDPKGAEKIGSFMKANPGGFATLEDVAEAVTAYNPHRPRPRDNSGLRKNLREENGRFYWHWDPAFLGSRRLNPAAYQSRLEEAARGLSIPTLLVRGNRSEIVGDAEAAHFRELMPAAEYVDVMHAGHMVAGDQNDAFNSAIVEFLKRTDGKPL
jgi:pimeloyl-ACP methyl ester carboxylesterase